MRSSSGVLMHWFDCQNIASQHSNRRIQVNVAQSGPSPNVKGMNDANAPLEALVSSQR